MLSEFEAQREERIADNKRRLQELGLLDLLPQPTESAPRAKRAKRAAPVAKTATWGLRQRKPVSYKEMEVALPRERKVSSRTASAADLDALRSSFADENTAPSSSARKRVDSGKGVRIQGGRVYDSTYGITCHWCRQKTLEEHVTCSNESCGHGKRMPTSFCKMCLRNRHGEDAAVAAASGQWVCPGCRGSCGPGCSLCCNCGPCRKKAGLGPTFQMVKLAKEEGYGNVHDYLIGQATGAPPSQVASRKLKFSWGKWLEEASQVDRDAANDDPAAVPPPIPTTPTATARNRRGRAAPSPQTEDAAPAPSTAARVTIKSEETEGDAEEGGQEERVEEAARPLSRRQRIMQQLGLTPASA